MSLFYEVNHRYQLFEMSMSLFYEVNHRYQLFEMSHRTCVNDIIGGSSGLCIFLLEMNHRDFIHIYGEESP